MKQLVEKSKKPQDSAPKNPPETPKTNDLPPETGGRGGLEPTRYGDWEISGKCVDF